jgi:Antitoxin Xre/MbcA/ParS C-terminal toxin-binding domain
MATLLSYPTTAYVPAPLVDFNSLEERKRLSASSLVVFFNMMKIWKVRDEDAKLLLGGISNGPFYEMKKSPKNRVLDVDQMFRVSYLLGIFKAINILHGQKLADEWVRLPNRNILFGGKTPLEYMTAGGLPAMQNVRRLLDGRRGGV